MKQVTCLECGGNGSGLGLTPACIECYGSGVMCAEDCPGMLPQSPPPKGVWKPRASCEDAKGWIVILELATPPWQMRPHFFRGHWDGRRTYRIGWLGVSVSVYRAEGLHTFFDHIENTSWQEAKP